MTSLPEAAYPEAMRANLHLHSRISDGGDWPSDVAARAARAGLEMAVLTDHDSLGGTVEFARAAAALGIATLPGVEIDCREPVLDYKSELLAYFPRGTYAHTAHYLEKTGRERLKMIREALSRAAACFPSFPISFDELLWRKQADRHEISPEHFSFNKVDVYRYLRDLGAIAPDIEYKAFKRAWFDSGLLGNKVNTKPGCEEIVETVKSDGGVVVVPHIGHEFSDSVKRLQDEKDRLQTLIDYFASIGVEGIELYWYRNADTEGINKIVKKQAKARGLFCTYGSDCHGPGSGKETMGAFCGGFSGFR